MDDIKSFLLRVKVGSNKPRGVSEMTELFILGNRYFMKKATRKIGWISLNILTNGAAFALFGKPKYSAITQVIAISFALIMSYLATFSPWVMVLALVLSLVYAFAIGKLTLKTYETHHTKNALWFLIFIITSICVFPVYEHLRPSKTYVMGSKHSEPYILEGEKFLVNLNSKEYAPKNFVLVKGPDGFLKVRRIHTIKDQTVIFDSPENDLTTPFPTEEIQGKVLYIYFSKHREGYFKWL